MAFLPLPSPWDYRVISRSVAWAGKEPTQSPLAALTEANCRDALGWGGVTQPCLVGDDAQLSEETL